MKNHKISVSEYYNRRAYAERQKRRYFSDGEQKEFSDKLMLELKSQNSAQHELLKKELESKSFKDSAEKKALEDKIADLETKSAQIDLAKAFSDKLRSDLDTIGVEMKALKEAKGKETKTSLVDEVKANMEAIKNLATKQATKEIVLKALTNRASIAGNEQAFELPDIGQLATRKLSLYDLFPKYPLGDNNNGTVRYYDWDKDTIVRAAAAVAEGAAFPESTAKFITNTISLAKVGDTLPITSEFFEDEVMFAGELNAFLNINVQLEIDRQLCLSTGASNEMTGIFASVNAYTLPVTGTVVAANIYDLFVKVSEAITTTGGAKYMPDFAIMNITDINRMKLTKDNFNNYILPPFVSKDGNQVAAMSVIESNIVIANTMLIGDRRFARIYEKGGIELSQGMVNAQFTSDEMTLKARKRMLFLIRSADKNGFLKVTDIDAAVVAITKP